MNCRADHTSSQDRATWDQTSRADIEMGFKEVGYNLPEDGCDEDEGEDDDADGAIDELDKSAVGGVPGLVMIRANNADAVEFPPILRTPIPRLVGPAVGSARGTVENMVDGFGGRAPVGRGAEAKLPDGGK